MFHADLKVSKKALKTLKVESLKYEKNHYELSFFQK